MNLKTIRIKVGVHRAKKEGRECGKLRGRGGVGWFCKKQVSNVNSFFSKSSTLKGDG